MRVLNLDDILVVQNLISEQKNYNFPLYTVEKRVGLVRPTAGRAGGGRGWPDGPFPSHRQGIERTER